MRPAQVLKEKKPRLHVCMIAREFPPDLGGIGHYVYYLSRKLRERGHESTVITRGSVDKIVRKSVDGIEVFYAPFFPLYPFHILIHGVFVNRLLRSLEPKLSLVHLHSPITPPTKTSLPIVTTIHTPMKIDARYHEILDFFSLAEKVQSTVIYPPIESKLLSLSKMITSVSLSVARELREYGLDPNEISVVGNGVDEKTFVPLQNRRSTERYVLYTGVLRARKGLFDLIECARHVCKARSDIKFVMCGTGPFLHRLEKKVRELGLQKRIVFLGYVERSALIRIYQNATLYISPSHYEGLPTVLLEAMSCGLPVVATNVGGNSEVISSGLNGFLVPPKSPEAIAQTILGLLDNDELRKRLGAASRKTIEDHYTWDRVTDNILECYENVLKK